MANTPNIRFKGFTDAWEQRKFSEVVTIERGGSPRPIDKFITKDENGLNWVKIGDAPEQGNYITQTSEKIRPEGLSKTREVHPGDLILSNSMSFGRPYIMAIDGCIHDGWLAIRDSQKNFDLKFLCILLGTDNMLSQYKAMAAGSTVNNLNKDLVGGTTVSYPSMDEQIKIGEYFETLDNLITLHQRKCDETKSLKKYMLQKMFPKNGEQFPEIRFSGFTDAWEQRKLGEILEIVNNKNGDSYGKEDVLSVSDEYGCINQIRFQGRSFAGEDISNYKIVETGDIVYTRSPLKSKPYGIIKVVGDETGIVSPLYIVNKAKPGNDSEFIYRVFDSPEKTNTYLSPLVRKGAKNTMNVSNDEWLSGEIIVAPSFDEQQKIGEYFKQLDNLITLHQRKCDELKEVKKYMLQNMFPKA